MFCHNTVMSGIVKKNLKRSSLDENHPDGDDYYFLLDNYVSLG